MNIRLNYTEFTREYPPTYWWYPPTVQMVSLHSTDGIPSKYWTFSKVLNGIPPKYCWHPTPVLNTLQSIDDIPNGNDDIPIVLIILHCTTETFLRVIKQKTYILLSRQSETVSKLLLGTLLPPLRVPSQPASFVLITSACCSLVSAGLWSSSTHSTLEWLALRWSLSRILKGW